MRLLSIIVVMISLSIANAEDKIRMNFNNEELMKIIEVYSKASGQKFVIDPSVRGKVSILLQDPVSVEEAFNHLSSALALNGFAISKQGDTMVIKSARNIQRDLIEVSTERPSIKPERMYTWVYTVKHLSVESLNRDLRILSSKDGEMTINTATNQIIISDWVSNLNRVAELMKEIDIPLDAGTAKVVEASKKERESRRKEQASKKE
ncbi:MAG: secretin N-terminal domain-containing protein [Pseudobdellovibrionaceae bacterium]